MASSIVLKKATEFPGLLISKFLRPLGYLIAVPSRTFNSKAHSSDSDDETEKRHRFFGGPDGYGGVVRDGFGNMIICYDVVKYFKSYGIEEMFGEEAPKDDSSN